MAGGQMILGRSFKYHRPRGIMSAGVEESGAMVTVGEGNRRDPNVKATMQELYEGLVASGQNAWPMCVLTSALSTVCSAGSFPQDFIIRPLWGFHRWNG